MEEMCKWRAEGDQECVKIFISEMKENIMRNRSQEKDDINLNKKKRD
jgi:hypothetical protein